MTSSEASGRQSILVEGPLPAECTTKLCHSEPQWAVRHNDDVSRQVGEPAHPDDPASDGSVAPYVCDSCRRDRYPGVESDDWVHVAVVDDEHRNTADHGGDLR